MAVCDEGAGRFHGLCHDVDQIHGPPLEIDRAARDARDVEKIVEQPSLVADLALDDLAAPLDRRRIVRLDMEHVGGGQDRRQRVPELVRQHREELVLVADRVLGAAELLDLGLQLGVAREQRLVGDPQLFVGHLHLLRAVLQVLGHQLELNPQALHLAAVFGADHHAQQPVAEPHRRHIEDDHALAIAGRHALLLEPDAIAAALDVFDRGPQAGGSIGEGQVLEGRSARDGVI